MGDGSSGWKHRPASLAYFAIFNPSFSKSEDSANDQICLFYPSTVPADERARQVGLATALVNFTKTFSSAPCDAVHTRKHRVILHEVEPGYWMLLKVRLGTRTTVRAGHKVVEHLEDGLQDSILRSVLLRAWEAFKLFHRGIDCILKLHSMDMLRKTLEEFYSGFLPRINFGSLDLLDAFDGIQFASLSKAAYLQVLSLMRALTATFPMLKHPVLFWHDHLVWNGLDSFDALKPLHSYITDPETGRVYDGVVNQVKRKGEPIIATRRISLQSVRQSRSFLKSPRRGSKFSGYLVGPVTIGSLDVELKKIYLKPEGVEHNLIVYQVEEECTVVVPVPASEPSDQHSPEFYARLSAFLDERLTMLVPLLADGYANAKNLGEFADQHFRYFYYNSMNLAFKTSIGSYKSTVLTPDLVQCLNRMHDEFARGEHGTAANEICVKTASMDAWVVGRRSGDRELYVVFPKSDVGIVDIDDEVKKFTLGYFSDIL
ncbi:vacuolar fusion protein ccz1 [Geranomyces variabilis]|nr:vacuolar fusion protein ccz1 [Geranomyces variabilis]